MTSSTFADAQRRVLERQARRHAEDNALRSSAPVPAPTTFGRLYASSAPYISHLTSREGTHPPFRVSQVDAELLDEELLTLLQDQVGEALKYYSSSLRDDYSSEIFLALRAILFKLSIWDHDATYGAALQGLKYSDARSSPVVPSPPSLLQKAAYGLFTVFGRYGWEKWDSYLLWRSSENDYNYNTSARQQNQVIQRLARLTSLFSTTHGIAAFFSFLVFLVNGRYRTLTDRLLRLRLVPASSQASREVSFEYLNRQLVWHAFTEFLLFLLPLVGIGRWRRWLSRAWRRAKLARKKSSQDPDAEDEEEEKTGPLAYLPEFTCAICYADQNPESVSEAELLGVSGAAGAGGGGVIGSASTDISNPYEAIPCNCLYCFVCLATKVEAEQGDGWICLRCGEVIKECRPWAGDVITQMQKTPGRKEVEFGDEKLDQETPPLSDLDPKAEEYVETADTLQEANQWSEIDRESFATDDLDEASDDISAK